MNDHRRMAVDAYTLTSNQHLAFALVFFFGQIALFLLAFLVLTFMISKVYNIFFDLVEVLLFFNDIDLQPLRQTTQNFLAMVEKTSESASASDQNQDFQEGKDASILLRPPFYPSRSIHRGKMDIEANLMADQSRGG